MEGQVDAVGKRPGVVHDDLPGPRVRVVDRVERGVLVVGEHELVTFGRYDL